MDTKLILIARVSDVEQRKALPAQKLRFMRYAEEKGLSHEYHEFDESAFKDVRVKFAKLIQHIKKQPGMCYVVFDKIDRFSRDSSSEERRELTALMRSGRVQMHFPSDNLFVHKGSPAADLFRLDIGVALATYYSSSIRDNVQRRFSQMLNDKTWIGAAPLGYLNVKRDNVKTIERDPERAHHIVRIFELRSTGMSYAEIAKAMNKAGLRSKRGAKMTKNDIEKVCRRPFYYGKMLYEGELLPHKYEPLITYKLFKQCQAVRAIRHDTHTTYDSLKFAFKDMIKCGKCGCTVSCFYAKGIPYAKCSGAKGKCGNLNTAVSLILPEIERVLGSIQLPPEVIPFVIDELKKRHDNQVDYFAKSLATARAECDRTTERLKQLTYQRLDNKIPEELYNNMLSDLTNRQQELNEQIESLTASNTSFSVTASYLLSLAQRAGELFMNADEALKQKLLKFVLSNLVLEDKKLSYDINDLFNTFIEIKKKSLDGSQTQNWCGLRDSNPWPHPWQGCALNN